MITFFKRSAKKYLDQKSANLRQSKLGPIFKELQSGSFVMDIGVWCSMPEPHPAENWLEKQDKRSGKLVAVGLDDMRQFKEKYPDVLCVQANGCYLPFRNGAVDIAFANAVLEHVPKEGQSMFVKEISRVINNYALLAVPDRLCPLEIHSRIPFVHWLPFWRLVFKKLGEEFWSLPSNLSTIFTKPSLSRLLNNPRREQYNWEVQRQTLFGIPVSLIAYYKQKKNILKDE